MTATRLKELRERAGLSMQALAARAGTSAPQINKLEKGERRLTLDWMVRLSRGLGVDLAELLPARAEAAAAAGPAPADPVPGSFPPPAETGGMIPMRSAARGGGEQQMFLADGPIDYIRCPPSLARVRDAYAIYMVGDSMTPRFRQGQILHVNPYKPPQPGAGVVVTKLDDAVLIKEFVRRGADTLHLRQYCPEGPIDIGLAEIRDIHTVVGLDEP
jgi:phage repressor protein C with HTH and peptisase S24 domain